MIVLASRPEIQEKKKKKVNINEIRSNNKQIEEMIDKL